MEIEEEDEEKCGCIRKKKRRGSINEYDEIGQQGVAAALETQPEPDDRKFNFI